MVITLNLISQKNYLHRQFLYLLFSSKLHVYSKMDVLFRTLYVQIKVYITYKHPPHLACSPPSQVLGFRPGRVHNNCPVALHPVMCGPHPQRHLAPELDGAVSP